jgi:hypothetical protein
MYLKLDARMWTGFIWLRREPVVDSCEHGNEPSGSINGWECLKRLSDFQLFKEVYASWSKLISYSVSMESNERLQDGYECCFGEEVKGRCRGIFKSHYSFLERLRYRRSPGRHSNCVSLRNGRLSDVSDSSHKRVVAYSGTIAFKAHPPPLSGSRRGLLGCDAV